MNTVSVDDFNSGLFDEKNLLQITSKPVKSEDESVALIPSELALALKPSTFLDEFTKQKEEFKLKMATAWPAPRAATGIPGACR